MLQRIGGPYLIATQIGIVVVHDGYFYWTHRLLHLRQMFRLFHNTHHRSRAPTAFASYAFGPAESFIHATYVPLFAWCFPIHSMVLMFFMLHMMVRVALIHCGVELMPRWALDHPILEWLTTTTHHDLHHSRSRWNYGLYFTWWDRLMNTEHPEYVRDFGRHHDPDIKRQPILHNSLGIGRSSR
jgi:lathosterol oxidase